MNALFLLVAVLHLVLEIIYQDDYLVAINKPPGLLVHRSGLDKYETQNAMHLLRDQLGQWVYPVHRLDKPTSGVLLFALDENTARAMGECFAQGTIEKHYLAVVRGFTPESGVIDHPLTPIADFKSQKHKVSQKPAQEAITYYERLSTIELPIAVDKYPTCRYSLVKLMPKTGRKHQLRRHLKHISHPIIGDAKYGKSKHNRFFAEYFESERLLLAAVRLCFMHPAKGNTVEITVECKRVFDGLITSVFPTNQQHEVLSIQPIT